MTDIVDIFKTIIEPNRIKVGDKIPIKYLGKNKSLSRAECLLRPVNSEEVSSILKVCNDNKRIVVAQGGMSGLVGGGDTNSGDIIVSLELLNTIYEIDPVDRVLIAGAGVILQHAQEKVDEIDCMLPVDLGARGSATLGGLISTNAGGNRVIRYGMTRYSVLGLEAVTANGEIISSMNRMIKNNAGYDLKQLFIGSEGSLGIITKCVIKLYPKPKSFSTAFVGIDDFDSLKEFLTYTDKELSGGLGAFEVMWSDYYDCVKSNYPSMQMPLTSKYKYYVLIEMLGSDPIKDQEKFTDALGFALNNKLIEDVVVAKSDTDRKKLWAIREDVYEVFKKLSPIFTYDVSMPIKDMEFFADETKKKMGSMFKDSTTLIFGHLGDGNLHLVVSVGDDHDESHRKVNNIIYGIISDLGGSISAEHGIGTEKKDYLKMTRNKQEIDLMKTLKRSLDPNSILNPGKIFD